MNLFVKHKNNETHGFFNFTFGYGNDDYDNSVNRKFAMDDEYSEKEAIKTVVGNFFEFMSQTELMSPLFFKVTRGMSNTYLKKMLNMDDDSEKEEKETLPIDAEKEKKIQEILKDKEGFKKFVDQFVNGEEPFRKQIFEMFIREISKKE